MAQKITNGEAPLRALSMSVQLSTRTACNAGCKFCISRTTANNGGEELVGVKYCTMNRLEVGMDYAERIGATHLILTGKADPLQEDLKYLCEIIRRARQHKFLVDMHTNGRKLLDVTNLLGAHDRLEALVDAGLTNLTLSTASFDDAVNKELMRFDQNPAMLIAEALKHELFVRCSLVVNKQGAKDFKGVMDYIDAAGNAGAHAVVIREVWVPDRFMGEKPEVFEWNKKNRVPIIPIQKRFIDVASDPNNRYNLSLRDPLPWGQPVFTRSGVFKNKNHGVNITFARCDEGTTGNIIKSLIHGPDGHGRRNWDDSGDNLY